MKPLPLLFLVPVMLLVCGCTPQPVKKTLQRTSDSLKTLTPNVPTEYQSGVDALQKENEAASNLTGKPAQPATPIIFAKDEAGNPVETADQPGVAESKANTAELERKLKEREARIAALDSMVKWGLGLLGTKGVILLSLYTALRKRKQQVISLVEGTQDTLGKLAALPGQFQGKTAAEMLAVLVTVPEMVKGVHKEYQDARGVWLSLKEDISRAKEASKVGDRTAEALNLARNGS